MTLNWALRNSLYVNPNPQNFFKIKQHGLGYNWCLMHRNIFGLDEIRPRTGIFTTPWNLENTSLFPVIDTDQQSTEILSNLLDMRALTIFKIAQQKNKKILIMWSGGIDSTCVLAAFIKNLTKSDLDNIVVCATTGSVIENPYFYHTFISKKLKMLHLADLEISESFLNQYIVLTGDPGDCVVGPSISKYAPLLDDNRHVLSWRDNQDILINLYNDKDWPTFGTWWVNKVSENLQEVQEQGKFMNIITIADWHWWQYYNLKASGSTMRPILKHKKNFKEKISQENLLDYINCNFFGDASIMSWSYNNLAHLLENGWKSHKKDFKNYIYDLDKNLNYQNNKPKIKSSYYSDPGTIIMDKDCVIYKFNESGIDTLTTDAINRYPG